MERVQKRQSYKTKFVCVTNCVFLRGNLFYWIDSCNSSFLLGNEILLMKFIWKWKTFHILCCSLFQYEMFNFKFTMFFGVKRVESSEHIVNPSPPTNNTSKREGAWERKRDNIGIEILNSRSILREPDFFRKWGPQSSPRATYWILTMLYVCCYWIIVILFFSKSCFLTNTKSFQNVPIFH